MIKNENIINLSHHQLSKTEYKPLLNMATIKCEHITSCGCGKTRITALFNTNTNTCDFEYYDHWMGHSHPNIKKTYNVIYADFTASPFAFHAYVDISKCMRLEFTSYPMLTNLVDFSIEQEKFFMSNSDDEFKLNGVVCAYKNSCPLDDDDQIDGISYDLFNGKSLNISVISSNIDHYHFNCADRPAEDYEEEYDKDHKENDDTEHATEK